nr:MAG TPA: hypothetical protein [Caudoviricetes sp.]
MPVLIFVALFRSLAPARYTNQRLSTLAFMVSSSSMFSSLFF